MSVDITAKIGIGWIISQEKRNEMEENAGDQWDDFGNHFRYINNYGDSDTFFGKVLKCVDCGDWEYIGDLGQNIDFNRFSDTMTEILHICGQDICPDGEWANPQLILFNQLW